MNGFFRFRLLFLFVLVLFASMLPQFPEALALAAPATNTTTPPPPASVCSWISAGNSTSAMNGASARTSRSPAPAMGPASVVFSDASWRRVDLPHDWAVELPFDQHADAGHGFKALGAEFPKNSVAWYRRTFTLPATDAGRRLWLELDGVFRDATVFVNGWFVGHHESGYSSFRYDITDVAEPGGRNVVAVRVDATETEGWFYEGAGIYRHIWLVKTGPLAVAPDGVFVHGSFKNNTPGGPAKVSTGDPPRQRRGRPRRRAGDLDHRRPRRPVGRHARGARPGWPPPRPPTSPNPPPSRSPPSGRRRAPAFTS